MKGCGACRTPSKKMVGTAGGRCRRSGQRSPVGKARWNCCSHTKAVRWWLLSRGEAEDTGCAIRCGMSSRWPAAAAKQVEEASLVGRRRRAIGCVGGRAGSPRPRGRWDTGSGWSAGSRGVARWPSGVVGAGRHEACRLRVVRGEGGAPVGAAR